MQNIRTTTLSFSKTVLTALFVMLSSTMLFAQIPSPAQEEVLVIRAAEVHTLEGEAIMEGMIIIENGIIQAVGRNLEVPAGAIVKDYTGMQVYPAFIHSRNLLGITEIGAVPVTSDFNELGNINPNVRPQVAFHPESSHIGIASAHGIGIVVTTPSGGIISGQAAAMYTDGWTWEQMTKQTPVGMVINWPNMINNSNLEKELKELQDAFDKARRFHTAQKSDRHHPVDIRWESMVPVLEREVPVLIHANEISQIQAAITWAKNENLKMILTGGRDAAYLADQLAREQIPVILTPIIGGPARQWEHYGISYAKAAALYEAGVQFAIAGDFGATGAYRLPHHAAAAVAFGLPHSEALKSITLYPARLLGLEDRAGSISPGKEAHLIICNGDPLEFATQIQQVYILGKEIDMQNKHRQLYDKYRIKKEQGK